MTLGVRDIHIGVSEASTHPCGKISVPRAIDVAAKCAAHVPPPPRHTYWTHGR